MFPSNLNHLSQDLNSHALLAIRKRLKIYSSKIIISKIIPLLLSELMTNNLLTYFPLLITICSGVIFSDFQWSFSNCHQFKHLFINRLSLKEDCKIVCVLIVDLQVQLLQFQITIFGTQNCLQKSHNFTQIAHRPSAQLHFTLTHIPAETHKRILIIVMSF